jgi:ligand-binding sensor domain-containing protein
MWIGTYGLGLNKFISENNEGIPQCYTTDDGLPNKIIFRILEDNTGNFWLTTDYSLSMYEPLQNIFTYFFTADGLLNNQYYWNAEFKNEQ